MVKNYILVKNIMFPNKKNDPCYEIKFLFNNCMKTYNNNIQKCVKLRHELEKCIKNKPIL